MRRTILNLIFAINALTLIGVWGMMLAGHLPIKPVHQLTFYARQHEHFSIYLADTDHKLVVNLTPSVREAIRPAWSPDGERIAFFSVSPNQNILAGLYVMDADGRNLGRLSATVSVAYPAWSADGNSITYTSDKRGEEGIYRVALKAGSQEKITGQVASLLAPSPDGNKLAYMAACDNNCDIFLMDADGRNPYQLTRNGLFDVFPVWSPDSQRISFMSNRDQFFELYVVDADCAVRPGGCDANARRLTHNRDFDGFPVWSPDGTRLLFSSDRVGNFDLYSIDAACSTIRTCDRSTRQLTDQPEDDVSPSWSPDGVWIAFVSGRAVYVMGADGGNIHHLMDNVLPDQFLYWRP